MSWFRRLLLLAGSSIATFAASSPDNARDQPNPYLVLPPGGLDRGAAEKNAERYGDRELKLRHIYHRGAHSYPNLHRYIDVSPDTPFEIVTEDGSSKSVASESFRVRAAPLSVQRLANRQSSAIDSLIHHAEKYGEAASLPDSAWTVDEIAGPNVTDKESVLNFAKMAADAYEQVPGEGDWKDIGLGFNHSTSFGWELDGLRGHIFADDSNSTVVIALKGTTAAVFDGAETTSNDKFNDNLFGSCCCGQGGSYWWREACKCMTSTYTCNSTCVVSELHRNDRYYHAGLELYRNVTERYPHADVWMAGHSLGGVVSSLLGLTHGLPTMTFEAYPDALAASRLKLPVPPGYKIGSHQSRSQLAIYHFGHTADPVYMGVCNGASSWCSLAGYAFEGSCHTGHTCTFDTMEDLGLRVGIGYHRILFVVDKVLSKYDSVPTCEEDLECSDCFNWKFFKSNGSEITTTSTSTSTSTSSRTRTETCKTPGWWGCLDETTTSTSSSSSSTSTCKTPGWFGCKDPTTTTTTTTTTSTSSSAARTPSAAPAPTVTATATPTTRGPSAPSSSPTTSPGTPQRRKCVRRHWYGLCKEWRLEPALFRNDL